MEGKRFTGHTGFKGAWLCSMLNYMDADITGYALSAEAGSLFEKIQGNNMVHHIEGAVHDLDSLKIAVCVN